MFYTYVLYSLKDHQYYTGYTSDLKKRVSDHNNGRVFSTKNRRPFELIYFEGCLSEMDAKRREKYTKSGNGKIYLKNRLKYYFGNDLIRLITQRASGIIGAQ